MTAFFERIVLNPEYASKVRLLLIEHELQVLRGENGEKYAQYVGIADREAAIALLETEQVTLMAGGTA